jgi:hypothetical protein
MHSDIPLCATAIHTKLSIGVRLDPSSLIKAFPTFSQLHFFLIFFCFVVHVWRQAGIRFCSSGEAKMPMKLFMPANEQIMGPFVDVILVGRLGNGLDKGPAIEDGPDIPMDRDRIQQWPTTGGRLAEAFAANRSLCALRIHRWDC